MLGLLDQLLVLGEDERLAVTQAFAQTQALPHRLDLVGECAGVSFFDDSIATTPESTLQALYTMKDEGYSLQFLLLGGEKQDFEYDDLFQEIVEQKVTYLVFLGE